MGVEELKGRQGLSGFLGFRVFGVRGGSGFRVGRR